MGASAATACEVGGDSTAVPKCPDRRLFRQANPTVPGPALALRDVLDASVSALAAGSLLVVQPKPRGGCHCAANSSRVAFLSVIVIGVPVIVRMNDPVSVLVRMTMFEVSRVPHDLLGLGNLGFGRLQP
jgi:hypothetical protein